MVDYIDTIAHDTSVKQMNVIRHPTKDKAGLLDFRNRPVYSVFDYGTITPALDLDNSTIALMAGFNFDLLQEEGVHTHYHGLVTEKGEVISSADAISRGETPWTIRVSYVNRVKPTFTEGEGWDYTMFQGTSADLEEEETNNFIVPIEFIVRNAIGEKSSVWRRVERGEIGFEDLGLPADFKPGDELPEAVLDYSTKFEPEDRYLRPDNARQLIGASEKLFETINTITHFSNDIISGYAESRGFKREDGKVEYAIIGGDPHLADAVGTWHEDRITWKGFGVSKQRIRDKEVSHNPRWYDEINRAKEEARRVGAEDFREFMDPSINHDDLPKAFIMKTNTLFQAATNQWVGERVYPIHEGDSLEDALDRAIDDFQRVA